MERSPPTHSPNANSTLHVKNSVQRKKKKWGKFVADSERETAERRLKDNWGREKEMEGETEGGERVRDGGRERDGNK